MSHSRSLICATFIALLAVSSVFARPRATVDDSAGLSVSGQVMKSNSRATNLSKDDYLNSRVIVNSGQISTSITENGHFQLNNLQPGKYLIEVTSHLFAYEKVVIQYYPRKGDSDGSVSIYSIDPFTYERIAEFPNPQRIVLKPTQQTPVKYFEDVEQFSIMSLFSGQGIMIVVMIAMYLCFKNVDMEKLQQQASDHPQLPDSTRAN